MLNPTDNLGGNSQAINIDTRKVKNGQIHFGMNLTFGRDKKEKLGEEAEEDRAAPVTDEGDKEATETKGSSETKNGVQGVKRKTVYGDKVIEPKKTDYNEGSKGKSSKSDSKSGKKTKSKSNYNKETKTKENKRKGPLVPKVEETQSKDRTYRKVSPKI